MNRVGSGDNGEITFLDLLAVMSFAIGLANYGENLTQSDKQELMEEVNQGVKTALHDIHEHLSVQDTKINLLLRLVEEKHDSRRDF